MGLYMWCLQLMKLNMLDSMKQESETSWNLWFLIGIMKSHTEILCIVFIPHKLTHRYHNLQRVWSSLCSSRMFPGKWTLDGIWTVIILSHTSFSVFHSTLLSLSKQNSRHFHHSAASCCHFQVSPFGQLSSKESLGSFHIRALNPHQYVSQDRVILESSECDISQCIKQEESHITVSDHKGVCQAQVPLKFSKYNALQLSSSCRLFLYKFRNLFILCGMVWNCHTYVFLTWKDDYSIILLNSCKCGTHCSVLIQCDGCTPKERNQDS